MTIYAKYKILKTNNLHLFKMGDKEFIYVNLVVEAEDGQLKEFNHETFTFDYWYEMIHHGYIYKKEIVGANVMVGDYYS